MSKLNSKTLFFSALFLFLFLQMQNSFAAEKFTLSIQDRYAENGIYYADLYATVPDGVTWTASSQTIIVSYNANAIKIDNLNDTDLLNLHSGFSGYDNSQKISGLEGKMSVNLTKFFQPFTEYSNETFRIATLRWNIIDGSLMDDLQIVGEDCEMLDDDIELSYNSDCDSETCFNVEQPTSQQVALPVPTLDSPDDLAMGQALNLSIEWNAVTHEAVDSYDVQVATDDAFSNIVLEDNTTSTSIALTGLSNGTEYYWRVRSSDDDMGITSDWSLPWEFKTLLSSPTLASPSDGTLGTSLTPTLTWNSVTGADGYLLYVEDATGTVVGPMPIASSTSYDIVSGALDNYENYDWYVKAYEEDGMGGSYESDPSDVWSFRTMVATPDISTPTDGTNGLNTDITFEWVDVTGAASYNIEIWENGSLLASDNVTNPMYEYNSFDYCAEYEWKVQAVDGDGFEGEFSNLATFETEAAPPALASPANETKNTPLDVTLEWDAVDCAVSYDVTIEWGEGNSYTDNVTGTTFNYALYDYFTDYTWYVEAIDQYGNYSDVSEMWEFRTTLDAPVLTTPADMANGLATTVDFEWEAVTGADEYEIEISQDGSVVFELTSNANSLTWNQFDYCSEYSWKVKAVDAEGYEGEFSDAFTFETKPAPPVLASVDDGAVNVPLDATLEWNSVPCAVEYDITIMWGEGNSFTETVTGTTYDYANYEYLTDYTWYVVAYDSYGNPSDESETWAFETIIEKPEVPALSSPADMATEVVLTGDVEWNEADRAETYEVEIATDDAFTTVVHNEEEISGLLSSYVGLDNDTDHWWRVRATNVGGTSDWSEVFEFKTMLLAPPMVTNPTNNESNTLLDFDVEWDDAQGAVAYNLQLSDDPTFATTIYDESELTVNSYTVSLDYGNTYYLRLQSIDEVDNLSNWGVTTFTTVDMPTFTGVDETCELSTEIYQAPDLDGATYTWTVTGGTYTSVDDRTIEVEFGTYGTANVELAREYGNINDNTDSDVELIELTYATVDIEIYHVEEEPCVNEPIDFEIDTENEDLHTYMWDFGDETETVYEMNPTHTFPGAGTYTVTLEVEGDNCTVGSATFDVTVVDDCPINITAKDFTDDDAVCKNSSVQMDVFVFGGDGNYEYDWTPSSDFFDATIEDATVKTAKIDRTYQIRVDDGNGLFAYGYSDVEVDEGEEFSLTSIWLPFPTAGTYIDLNSKVSDYDGELEDLNWSKGNNPVSEPDNEEVTPGLSLYYVYSQSEDACPSPTKRIIVYGLMGKQIPSDDIAVSLEGSAFAYSYPNPVRDNVTLGVEFANNVNAVISVHSLTGQKLLEFNINDTKSIEREIDLSEFSSGMYIIMIDTGNDTIVKRVIKE